jgi:hypothetical protein
MTSCRNTPPHRPPTINPSEYSSGASDRPITETNHAKPSSTISAPVRLSGRRRSAYRPVPMKLHPTAGPKIAQTALASWWSLERIRTTAAAPHTTAATTMPRMR